MARMQREARQRRYIILGSIVVVLAVLGLVAYGLLDQYYLKSLRPVAVVNGERISLGQFQAQARYTRQRLVQQALQTAQLLQYFGSSPEMQTSFQSQLAQIDAQLNPQVSGQGTVDQLVQNALIKQEAVKRGLTVTEPEMEKALQEGFGYFANGTPTTEPTLEPVPTSTLNPTQLALAPPTATATPTLALTGTLTATGTLAATEPVTVTGAVTVTTTGPAATPGVEPSATPTEAPSATPTPYTLEGYQAEYQKALEGLKTDLNFSEKDLRYIVETQLYTQKLQEAVLEELNVSRQQEQVWLRHIQLADEAAAKAAFDRLSGGEPWMAVAAEVSVDEFTKSQGGDLGWNSQSDLTARYSDAFAQAAFELEIGQISQPVQSASGWHLIQVLGHETRTLDQAAYDQLRQTAFQDWLTQTKDAAQIEVFPERWQAEAPSEPTLPAELVDFINTPIQQSTPAPAEQ